MIEFYFMESAVNCFRPRELTQRQCRHGVTSQPFWVGPTVLSGPLHDFLQDYWQCFAMYPQILLHSPSPHPCLTVYHCCKYLFGT